MSLIDISMPLTNQTPGWPGDEVFRYQLSATFEDTGTVNVGKFSSSNHTATHVDAPFHYDPNGLKLGEIPLERFSGDALVVNVEGIAEITASDLKPFDFSNVNKVLFRSNSWADRTRFPNHGYTVIGEDAAPFLKEQNIDLIGVDTPSVDPENSKELTAHHSLYKQDILILEGIQLDHVAPGIYELFAFPLKMEEADGSPVRAVLKQK
ncbi:cyclase family protein [Halobacillus salinarum]|uniref:Kynurenine formamidase n=1 Tax=Halobacillus salinarum TaxID=2932257 RepID=A0ABY4EMM1_9BACI|nr:cyclase family protein [Halobacillus salinarum]UOQ45245.1 cyclase family protein [Halobacillus salinarum]